MDRFEQELNGCFGSFWQKNAEHDLAVMCQHVKNHDIMIDSNNAAYWVSNGNYIPEHVISILQHTNFQFDVKATEKARNAQNEKFLEEYRAKKSRYTAEEKPN